ncbi:MAG: DUF1549 domain-containing protein, partial [Verrucomicrobia bacterium]|nr:DUF1549 domain-containing protein [Verrucomicrobiota bacterium]
LLPAATPEPTPDGPVSYYEDVLPLFQAKCHGCHQPAKAKGDYIMTSFESLLAGAETEGAIIPGDPAHSHLLEQITPDKNGEAEMPKKDTPLNPDEIALVHKWITEGAVDDTPENARQHYDAEHLPTYSRPPVITALDYSPDGSLLAISGFHEVLLHTIAADGSATPLARLVGLSERIESIRFSPDGTNLAVTGGLPGRMGEVQIWDVAKRKLSLSHPVTFDTVYGASWSPDGTKVAFGCADNTARVIDAKSGKQILFMGSHADWVLDTLFSTDGTHLVSSGRDQTAKLTKVDEERFIDNITSITPGALKGGLASLAKHPERDEILVGGADGVPQIYRVFRITTRVIGDNSNLIRKFPPMPGRIWSVDYRPDGKRVAASSSLDGKGAVHIFKSEFDTALPDDIKKIYGKTTPQWNADEAKRVEEYLTAGTDLLHAFSFDTPIFALSFSPDGTKLAASGQDGLIRIIDAETGTIAHSFSPVETTSPEIAAAAPQNNQTDPNLASNGKPFPPLDPETLPESRTITALSLFPAALNLNSPHAYRQLLVTAQFDNGDSADVTRQVTWSQSSPLLAISSRGLARPLTGGTLDLTATLGGQSATTKVTVSGLETSTAPDWVRDVTPVIAAAGCSAGTCHGSKEGKNGFKLSLRGYDPIFDVRAFTDDHGSRRTNLASPDDSLMLLKATGAVPHEGGQRMTIASKDYQTIRNWIAQGARLDLTVKKVQSIVITPENPVVQNIGGRQQFSVIATYPDGSTRDVTGEAFLEVGNTEVAATDKFALVSALRRGEAPILARYEGAYASTTMTVMGDRSGFAWQSPPVFNEIDSFTAAKWERMKILPSELATDNEFLRRVHLDLTGLPPTPEVIRSFLADQRETRTKRDEIIDQLVGSPAFVDFWTNKWADLLQVNRKFLGPEGAALLRTWIHNEVDNNTPYDEFARKILTATGSNKDNPPASYFKILRTPDLTMENTTHLFLGTRFNCNKCHDHPFERWTQNQYYETAAFFAQIGLDKDPASGKRQLGKTAVEEGNPLFELIVDRTEGEMLHERTQEVVPPAFPYAVPHQSPDNATRREQLAAWLTAPANPLFARSYANRIWGYLFGIGIIEPIDDIRAGNPATNPELLDWLTTRFVEEKFDVRTLFRTICKSRTYQLSVRTHEWNEDDTINFSHSTARRLPAEVLYDTIQSATGAVSHIPGVPAGTRAAALPDSGVALTDGFLGNLGRPTRESACECERVSSLELGPIMALVSGPTVGDAISDPKNLITSLAASDRSNEDLVNELYIRILNRPATSEEIQTGVATIQAIPEEHAKLVASLESFRVKLPPEVTAAITARTEAIATARTTLTAATTAWAAKKTKLEQENRTRAEALAAELAAYEKNTAANLAAWEQAGTHGTSWTPLAFTEMTSSNGASLTAQEDASIFVTGPNGKTKYTLTGETALTGITGIRLEALADDRLPAKGPGRSQNGNIVISEFTVATATKAEPDKWKPAPLKKATADFSQKGYEVATAIDGKAPASDNGWAVSPQLGKDHSARFETKNNLDSPHGTRLQITINQQFQDGTHSLGKFRLAVTTDPRPHQSGLPANLAEIIALPTDQRSPEQLKTLTDHFRSVDPKLHQLQTDLAAAKMPTPEPENLLAARKSLDELLALPPVSPRLANLESDVALSTSQATNARLTAAQDLAWALINSPAFLFNY